jgi:hypothetical protein
VLVRHKKTLLAMTASLAVLAALTSSTEAFPFDWFSPAPTQPTPVRSRPVTTHPVKPNPAAVAPAKETNDERSAATETSAADLTAKASGVLTIVISLNKQQLTLYSDGIAVARSRVSVSGGQSTPTGVFSIIQKQRSHRYDDTSVALMQRLTWSGLGIHQAITSKDAAARGSIGVPEAFARQLWAVTKIGARVIIANADVTPVAISSGRLFARRLEPAEQQAEVEVSSAQRVQGAYNALELGAAGSRNDRAAGGKAKDSALDAMAYAPRREAPLSSSEVVRSAYDRFDTAPRRAKATGAPSGVAEVHVLKAGPISVLVSRKEGKLFVRKGFDSVFSVPVTFDQLQRPLGTHVFTAFAVNGDEATLRWNVVSLGGGRGGASNAADALARVKIPADARERISDLISAGASLIISDNGLEAETGPGTDFVVLTQ